MLRLAAFDVLGGVEQRKVLADNLLRAVTRDSLRFLVPTGNAPFGIKHVSGAVLHPFQQQSQGFFGVLALRDVTNDCREKEAFAGLPGGERKFQREFSCVLSPSGQLDCLSNDSSFLGLHIPFDALPTGSAEPIGYDQRDGLCQGFLRRVAKHSRGCSVPVGDVPLGIRQNDGVGNSFCQCLESVLACVQCLPGPLVRGGNSFFDVVCESCVRRHVKDLLSLAELVGHGNEGRENGSHLRQRLITISIYSV